VEVNSKINIHISTKSPKIRGHIVVHYTVADSAEDELSLLGTTGQLFWLILELLQRSEYGIDLAFGADRLVELKDKARESGFSPWEHALGMQERVTSSPEQFTELRDKIREYDRLQSSMFKPVPPINENFGTIYAIFDWLLPRLVEANRKPYHNN